MSLSEGTKLGPYEITGKIGAGGMGEVYRATDTTLNRDVAIKVLPQSVAGEADRIARFEQEAKTLAALNHANIARIYGLEKAAGQAAIVMELVEGQTLADRISEGPIPADEAMGIAAQIMDALEAAHGRQIVHRDLKPANIVLKPDGTVTVLDFGIAKVFEPSMLASDGAMDIATTPVTQAGVILGTAAYMSPEQARGKFVDQRSDIWAFGCVLFEMLTGQSAFGGEDVPITLARVLAADTNLNSLPAMISPAVRQTLTLCLEKDPKKRIADIRDVRLAIQGEFETVVDGSAPVARRSAWWSVIAAAAAVLFAIAVGFGVWVFKPDSPRPVTRSLISDIAGPFAPIVFDVNLAVSRDGSRVAYRGTRDGEPRLLMRRIDGLAAISFDALPAEIRGIFFSPDGNWIGFSDGTAFYRVSINGGSAVPIGMADDGATRGATWGDDDTIIFATSGPTGLQRVALSGGEPEVVSWPDTDAGQNHWFPEFLPAGDAVLFTIISDSDAIENGQIAVLRLGDEEPTVLMAGTSPRYASSGHIVYAVGNTVQAVGFDAETLEITTNPFPVIEDVHINQNGASSFALARDGTLVYARGDAAAGLSELVLVSRDGGEELLPFEPGSYFWPRLSRDGTRVASALDNSDIWVGDTRRGTWIPVTTTAGVDNVPTWTPDDNSVVFATQRDQTGRFSFYQQSADGSGEAVRLLEAEQNGNFKPYVWTPDGTQLLFDYGQAAALNIGVLTLGGDQDWRPLFASEFVEAAPSLSPDGSWVAYASTRSGVCEIYAERFPGLGGRTTVSVGGGAEPLWSPTLDEVYYRQGTGLYAVRVEFGNSLQVGDPELIVDGLPTATCGARNYDISADGERFLVPRLVGSNDGSTPGMDLVLVQNWFQELERLVPAD